MEYQKEGYVLFYAKTDAFRLRELLGHAAAVVDAAVGGPSVKRSGHTYPFY